jgi:putative ABC transport system permease protein
MWRITLKGVLAHRLRYALTALAVLLGVSFIAGTLVLTDTTNSAFDGLYDQVYSGTAAVVRAPQPFDPGVSFTSSRPRVSASLIPVVARVPGVKAAVGDISGYAQLIGKNGKAIGNPAAGPPTIGSAWTDNTVLNQLRILPGGRPPRAGNEVVIDKHAADVGRFRVGDQVRVLTQHAPATYVIAGIATWGGEDSPLGATITAFTPVTAARVLGVPGMVSQINVQAAPGITQDALVDRLRAAISASSAGNPAARSIEVVSGQAITSESQQAVHQALGIIRTFLLVFAFIALFVGAFVIVNTFGIVVAQRLRELALLRAVGASRRQVTAAVLGESLVVGCVASAVGLAAGIGLAELLKVALSALGFGLPATGLVVNWRTIIISVLAGIVITVVSAIGPARRASRIPPVAALQDVAAAPQALSARRLTSGVLLAGAGAALLCTGLFAHVSNRMVFTGAGLVALFTGAAVLGPWAARRLLRLMPSRRNAPSHLGHANAERNPARSASTAAALMIGMALVSVMTVLAASLRASTGTIIDNAVRADYIVTGGGMSMSASGISPQAERQLAALPQVSEVAGVRGGIARIFGSVTSVVATDPAAAAPLVSIGVTSGDLAGMTSSGIAVSKQVASDHGLRVGTPVTVTFPSTGARTYTVQAVYSTREMAGDYVLPLAAAMQNFPQSLDMAIYLKVAPGVRVSDARPAIEKALSAYPSASVKDQAQYKADYEQQVNQLLNLVYVLLALAVLIALIGIANTLALSVSERTRELGLLRAVGATRRQLRAMVRAEALVISVFGAVEGLVLGTLFGLAVVAAMRSQGVSRLSVPVPQLLLLTALASLAGLVAAIAPARRAARLDILHAVTTE